MTTTFSDLKLSRALVKILNDQNYHTPYPIQEAAIPAILAGRDLLGIAQTGSGKTASYVLPILMNLRRKPIKNNRHINVLVLVPTRELTKQVDEAFKLFGESLTQPFKSLGVSGGSSINIQMKRLQNVNVLVATPGRLLDLVNSNAVHLSDVETLVLDEADKLLNPGFKVEMDQILALLSDDRQNLLFSATLNEDPKEIKDIELDDPLVVKIEPQEMKHDIDLINQTAYLVSDERKGPLLRYLIKSKEMKQVLVFTSSIARANRVADKLRKNGIDAKAIHRKKTQGVRDDFLTKFKHGKLAVLVATDLLARGIDIEFLPVVINYELPRSPKMFIHRIGRTGRAHNPGDAITLLSPEELHHFGVIEKKLFQNAPRVETEELDLSGY